MTGRDAAIQDCRLYVVDADDDKVRSISRPLRAVVGNVDVGDPNDPLPDDGEYDVVIAGYDSLPEETRKGLATRYAPPGAKTRLLLTCSGGWQQRHSAIFSDLRLKNLLARNDDAVDHDDLIVTLRKLMTRDIFGLSKYFIWGVEELTFRTGSSKDKDDIVDSVSAYAERLKVHKRLRAQACVVVDELLTNALYNAPVNAAGDRIYADLRRDTDVLLPDGAEVQVSVCCDGKRFGVAVRDPYGSLAPDDVIAYLAKCLGGGEMVEDKPGGAGIGLFQVFDAVSHFVVNIAPGQGAEAIGIISVEGGYRSFATRGKSFNIFVDEE
jgi:hypothetical protein